MKKNQASDEINLLEIFLTIIDNKIKIILITVLTIAVVFGLKIIGGNSAKKSKFTTSIKAISIFEETRNYQDLKFDLNFNGDFKKLELNRFTLFEMFIKTFESEKKELLKNFNFIKRENYENEDAYEAALDQIVSSINIVKREGDIYNNKKLDKADIIFFSQNEDISNKWGEFLNTLEYSVNKITQKYLKEVIVNKINNAKTTRQNEVEDIENEIKTNLRYHELEIQSRLSFLEEQAKIAREGNVESEKVTPSSFGTNYSINYNEDGLLSLYYLKGYRVIEKEIELIKKRKNAYFFAKGMPNLEARKIKLESDQSIVRVEAEFKKTPIFDDDNFSGGLIETTSIKLIKNNFDFSTRKWIILASLIGLIIGVFYVLISNAISNAMIRDRK
jgi:LPS O-antigen subunit length determinant protein (WzzB/FepE family)